MVYEERVQAAIAQHVRAILEMQRRGAVAFDYGNNLRTQAKIAGVADAFSYPGFVPAFIRDSFCEGRGPFRWVALSGDPADIAQPIRRCWSLFPEDKRLQEWLTFASKSRLRFKACLHGSAGSDTRNAIGPDCCSIKWCGTGG